MNAKIKSYIALLIWIAALILMGSVIGSLTQTDITIWYSTLHRSPLTPPNYVFPIAWTILYTIIATCGWLLWRAPSAPKLRLIKSIYVLQLIVNLSWSPLFFYYHLIGLSLINALVMDIAVIMIICLGYVKFRSISLLMTPYLLWIIFATYLNFYIWQHN